MRSRSNRKVASFSVCTGSPHRVFHASMRRGHGKSESVQRYHWQTLRTARTHPLLTAVFRIQSYRRSRSGVAHFQLRCSVIIISGNTGMPILAYVGWYRHQCELAFSHPKLPSSLGIRLIYSMALMTSCSKVMLVKSCGSMSTQIRVGDMFSDSRNWGLQMCSTDRSCVHGRCKSNRLPPFLRGLSYMYTTKYDSATQQRSAYGRAQLAVDSSTTSNTVDLDSSLATNSGKARSALVDYANRLTRCL